LIKLETSKSTVSGGECREGELYRVVNVQGTQFSLYYGYYEEIDRANPLAKPIPIYPDLLREPQYTEKGDRIVTMMQDGCEHYRGMRNGDDSCGDCKHFLRCEELFGICKRKTENATVHIIKGSAAQITVERNKKQINQTNLEETT